MRWPLRRLAKALLGLGALLALGVSCSSTGPGSDGPAGESWRVSGGIGLQDQGFGLSLSGVQMFLDGKLVYSHTQNPTFFMAAGFGSTPLAVGDHVMSIKIVGQVGTTVSYVVTGLVDMTLGLTTPDTRSFQWPDRLMTLRVGDVVEFPFKVPL